MIHAEFTINRDTEAISLRVSGHAASAEKGRDLVCAAVSVLTYTLAQIAVIMENDGKLRRPPVLRLAEGEAEITVRPKKEFFDEALYAFYNCEVGMTLLAKDYGQYVRMKGFERS